MADKRFGNNNDGSGTDGEEIYIVPAGAITATPGDQSEWTMQNTDGFTVTLSSSFTAGFKLGDWGNASGSVEVERKFSKEWKATSGAAKMTDEPYASADLLSDRFLSVIVFQALTSHKLVQHWGVDGYIADPSTTDVCTPTFDGFKPSDDEWGRTPQSKVEDLTGGRSDWLHFVVGQTIPFTTGGHFEKYKKPSGGSS